MRWIMRARPKTDRIACPWLIRRFIDPEAEIVFQPAIEVVPASAQDPDAALQRLASIVHAADISGLDSDPLGPGLLAIGEFACAVLYARCRRQTVPAGGAS